MSLSLLRVLLSFSCLSTKSHLSNAIEVVSSNFGDLRNTTALLEGHNLLFKRSRERLEIETTCNLPIPDKDDTVTEKDVTVLEPFPGLLKRAPALAPLAEPEGREQKDFDEFMNDIYESGYNNDPAYTHLQIKPKKNHIANWVIDSGKNRMHVGVTGVFFPFGNEPKTFFMIGLEGCTASIIVELAGHHWEGSGETNGGSSHTFKEFTHKLARELEPDESQRVAVDIIDTPTPKGKAKSRPLWRSLVDLKNGEEGDPFNVGESRDDRHIFVLTKADRSQPQDQGQFPPLFSEHINLLSNKYKELLPGAVYTQKTYVEHNPDIPFVGVQGLIVVQYTPYDNDGSVPGQCNPQARVRVFYENNMQPVIDKQWDATSEQLARKRRRDACVLPPTTITNPKPAPSSWPIKKGYVAFGDSFAAGMGTGVTTSDKCRVGTANVGDLIYSYTNNKHIDYQRRMCSGDTTAGLDRQIDEWQNPQNADLATLTMGGNDLGFSDIVKACVIRPFAILHNYAEECPKAKDNARKLIEDQSENGIEAKLVAAYKKIMDKSTREPNGFWRVGDDDPPDCNRTTFQFEHPVYCDLHKDEKCFPDDPNGPVFLTNALREELNKMVSDLGGVISNAVKKVNSTRVHFVDVAPYFDNHRWCELPTGPDDSYQHEPNQDRDKTWFFLSGWPDDYDYHDELKRSTFTGPTYHDELNQWSPSDKLVKTNSIRRRGQTPHTRAVNLPPHDTCEDDLGTDPDPVERWKCDISRSIAKTPEGYWAQKMNDIHHTVASRSLTPREVVSWYFTRQIKTFHPRTPGMHAYRDSITASIQANQAVHEAPLQPKSGGPCVGDAKYNWNMTIYNLKNSGDCKAETGAFSKCFVEHDASGNCLLASYNPVCAPPEHPQGLFATFWTRNDCDPSVLTDCIHRSFPVDLAVDDCMKA